MKPSRLEKKAMLRKEKGVVGKKQREDLKSHELQMLRISRNTVQGGMKLCRPLMLYIHDEKEELNPNLDIKERTCCCV